MIIKEDVERNRMYGKYDKDYNPFEKYEPIKSKCNI